MPTSCLRAALLRVELFLFALASFLLLSSPAVAQGTSYTVGSVPSVLPVSRGSQEDRPLSFLLKTAGASTVTYAYTVDRTPNGAMLLDAQSGQFSFAPARTDGGTYAVTFTATSTQGVSQQTVSVKVPLLPETDLVSKPQTPPDDASDDYVTISDITGTTPELFNHQNRATRTVTISGKRLIVDDNPASKLYLLCGYDPHTGRNSDIKTLTIYADSVIVRTPLALPQTNVIIYARHLEFQDKPGESTARIDTTPLNFTVPGAPASDTKPADNGTAGAKGGDISLYIKTLTAQQPGSVRRLLLRGGQGQDPGLGQDGANGLDLPTYDTPIPFYGKQNGIVWIDGVQGRIFGVKNTWPGNGHNALPAGKPGSGGSGGVLTSTIADAAALATTDGGAAGTTGGQNPVRPGGKTLGGRAGLPNPARAINQIGPFKLVFVKDPNPQLPGTDADAPAPDKPVGDTGQVVAVASSGSPWLHPAILSPVLAYARDLYLSGNLELTNDLLTTYVADAAAVQPSDDTASTYAQATLEMKSMQVRIASNLDFYGHPAGWVPSLNLETTMQLFDREINSDVPILYLAYWVQNVADKTQSAQAVLQTAMTQLESEAEQASQDYTRQSGLLPDLQIQSTQIADSTNRLFTELDQRDKELTQIAQDDVNARYDTPFWKSALGVVGTACKVIPVYQPALGAVGEGLTVLSNVDTQSPLTTARGLADVASQLNDANLAASKKQLDDQLATLTNRNHKPTKDYVKDLLSVGQKLGDAESAIARATEQSQAPQTEVQVELESLQQRDDEFKKLTQEATDLNTQKQAFAQSIASALDGMSSDTSQISSCLLSIDGMSGQVNKSIANIDFPTLLYVQDMQRRAKARLLEYQYYLSRSYEYRLLQPYTGNFRLNNLFDHMKDLLGQTGDAQLSSDQMSALAQIYKDELRRVIDDGIKLIQENPPASTTPPIPITLTAVQLADLNSGGHVTVRLGALINNTVGIGTRAENRRIVGLTIDSGHSHIQHDGVSDGTSYLNLIVQHSPKSTIFAGGKTFSFTHQASLTSAPISWLATYNPNTNSITNQPDAGAADASLLATYLNLDANVYMPQLELFATPSAEDAITIVAVPQGTASFTVKQLQLDVVSTFTPRLVNDIIVDFVSPADIDPLIHCDLADANGRADGYGSFRRVYPRGSQVTCGAPPFYPDPQTFGNTGQKIFDHWEDANAKRLSVSPVLTLSNLTTNVELHPIYK